MLNSEVSNQTTFLIFVDRIEGDYAVCEFPKNEMRDVHVSAFQKSGIDLIERQRYLIRILDDGSVWVICKVYILPEDSKKKQQSTKLIRFV